MLHRCDSIVVKPSSHIPVSYTHLDVYKRQPQTVNSSLKNLEKQGLIALTAIPGNKKNKLVVLTEKGKEMTQRIISALVLAEQKSLQGLKRSEQEALLSLTKKYVELLRAEIN